MQRDDPKPIGSGLDLAAGPSQVAEDDLLERITHFAYGYEPLQAIAHDL